jgi:hypothetical protein
MRDLHPLTSYRDAHAWAVCLECVGGDATELPACTNVRCPGYSGHVGRHRDAVRDFEPTWALNPKDERSVLDA